MIYKNIKNSRQDYTVAFHTADMDSDMPYIEPEYGYCVQLSGIELIGNGEIRSGDGDSKFLSIFEIVDDHYRRYRLSDVDINGELDGYRLATHSDICPIFHLNETGYYRTEGYIINFSGDAHPLNGKVIQKSPCLSMEKRTSDVSMLTESQIIEVQRPYEYMFDTKFANLLDDPDVCVRPMYSCRMRREITSDGGEFLTHMVYCKTKKKMQKIHRYFQKHFGLKSIMVYRDGSDHGVITHYKKARSLVESDAKIKVGNIQNKRMLYGFKISMDRARDLGMQDRIHSMLYARDELHCDLKINVYRDKHTILDVYARDDKIINKMKLLKMWKDIIIEMSINDEGLS